MTILQELEARLASALTATLGEPTSATVTAAADLRFGDYQSNAAMVLAKLRKTNPRALAQEIIDHLQLDGLATAENNFYPADAKSMAMGETMSKAEASYSIINELIVKRQPAEKTIFTRTLIIGAGGASSASAL